MIMLNEDATNVFKEQYVSALSKAVIISSNLNQSTDNTSNYKNHVEHKEKEEDVTLNAFKELRNLDSVADSSTSKSKSLLINHSKWVLPRNGQNHGSTTFRNNSPSVLAKKITQERSFPTQKLLHICDMQRCLTVEKVMIERIQSMQDSEKLINDSLEHLKQARQEETSTRWLLLEQKILDDIHEQELKNRPKREAQLVEDSMKNAQRALERIQKVKDAENEARKKSEVLRLHRLYHDKMFDCQREYSEQYKDIIKLISSCENKNLLMQKNNNAMKDLKNCSAEYEALFKTAKSNDITQDDVSHFVNLVEMIKQIYKNLKKEVESNNLADTKKESEVTVENVNDSAKVDVPKNQTEEPASDLSDCFDIKSLQKYLSLQSYLENVEKSCMGLEESTAMKKFRFSCHKAVTIPVNAISPVSGSHLADKYFKLHNLLSGKTVDVGGVQVAASEHPDGIMYCKKLLAKKFVRQGDLTVSSKPDAAFSIAVVLTSLWVDFPDFGQLTLAYFQRACPYLAPVFMPQVEGQSVEEYHKSLGYNYLQNGEVEKQDSFLKRMSGIMRLYAAVITAKVRQPGKQNPLGISEGWRWMAALLNVEPRPDICATLLFDFLEVAGNEMFRVYKAQFKKLLAYICQVYYPKLEKVTPASSGGPITRLEGFLQKIMKNESIPSPEGILDDQIFREFANKKTN